MMHSSRLDTKSSSSAPQKKPVTRQLISAGKVKALRDDRKITELFEVLRGRLESWIVPYFYAFFHEMYKDAADVKHVQTVEQRILQFQDDLHLVRRWDNAKMQLEHEQILSKNPMFVPCMETLVQLRVQQIHLGLCDGDPRETPIFHLHDPQRITYSMFQTIAKQFFENPVLFDLEEVDHATLLHNRHQIRSCIRQAVIDQLEQAVPLPFSGESQTLQKYYVPTAGTRRPAVGPVHSQTGPVKPSSSKALPLPLPREGEQSADEVEEDDDDESASSASSAVETEDDDDNNDEHTNTNGRTTGPAAAGVGVALPAAAVGQADQEGRRPTTPPSKAARGRGPERRIPDGRGPDGRGTGVRGGLDMLYSPAETDALLQSKRSPAKSPGSLRQTKITNFTEPNQQHRKKKHKKKSKSDKKTPTNNNTSGSSQAPFHFSFDSHNSQGATATATASSTVGSKPSATTPFSFGSPFQSFSGPASSSSSVLDLLPLDKLNDKDLQFAPAGSQESDSDEDSASDSDDADQGHSAARLVHDVLSQSRPAV